MADEEGGEGGGAEGVRRKEAELVGFVDGGVGEGASKVGERGEMLVGRGGGGRPEVDEAAEGEVGDEVGGVEGLHGCGASGVAGVEPTLDGGAVVGDAGAEAHRRPHHF
ncbi:hypothetical protein IEQ34_000420 [Dendrobium chrysotoxum]|uniref:Uncharacterized protein n=1 Tax=Dendrobium chrysotoxum TaxID=161865 RepID=A0AAV7HPJ2_DENCH|nr:hypothetical protein IEQ34_000420 [Dendrobium chrysotoxum]